MESTQQYIEQAKESWSLVAAARGSDNFDVPKCGSIANHCEILYSAVNSHIYRGVNYESIKDALILACHALEDCISFIYEPQSPADSEFRLSLHLKIDEALNAFPGSAAPPPDRAEYLQDLLRSGDKSKEFLSVEKAKRPEYLNHLEENAQVLRDLASLDLTDPRIDASAPATAVPLQGGLALYTKLALLEAHYGRINARDLVGVETPPITSGRTVFRSKYEGQNVALRRYVSSTGSGEPIRDKADVLAFCKEAAILQRCAMQGNIIRFVKASVERGIILTEWAECSLHAFIYTLPNLLPSLPAGLDHDHLRSFAYKASVVLDVASALYFLHTHDIIHRDVRPGTVRLVLAPPTESNPAKTLVAMLARLDGAITLSTLREAGYNQFNPAHDTGGEPGYIAPEILCARTQPNQPLPFTNAADMYSLGVLANELFSGKPPWDCMDRTPVRRNVCELRALPELYRPTDPLQQRVMDDVVGGLTFGCLSRVPTARPSAKGLSADDSVLREASGRLAGTAAKAKRPSPAPPSTSVPVTPLSPPTPSPTPPPRPPRPPRPLPQPPSPPRQQSPPASNPVPVPAPPAPGTRPSFAAHQAAEAQEAAAAVDEVMAAVMAEGSVALQEVLERVPQHVVGRENANGRTALSAAAKRGRVDTVSLLIEHGAEVGHHDSRDGANAFIVAARENQVEVLWFLFTEHRDMFDINAVDKGLNTALMVAAGRDKAEAVQALLGMEGLNLEVQNKMGDTALILAAYSGNVACVSLLLRAGANLQHRNRLNLSAGATSKLTVKAYLDKWVSEPFFCEEPRVTTPARSPAPSPRSSMRSPSSRTFPGTTARNGEAPDAARTSGPLPSSGTTAETTRQTTPAPAAPFDPPAPAPLPPEPNRTAAREHDVPAVAAPTSHLPTPGPGASGTHSVAPPSLSDYTGHPPPTSPPTAESVPGGSTSPAAASSEEGPATVDPPQPDFDASTYFDEEGSSKTHVTFAKSPHAKSWRSNSSASADPGESPFSPGVTRTFSTVSSIDEGDPAVWEGSILLLEAWSDEESLAYLQSLYAALQATAERWADKLTCEKALSTTVTHLTIAKDPAHRDLALVAELNKKKKDLDQKLTELNSRREDFTQWGEQKELLARVLADFGEYILGKLEETADYDEETNDLLERTGRLQKKLLQLQMVTPADTQDGTGPTQEQYTCVGEVLQDVHPLNYLIYPQTTAQGAPASRLLLSGRFSEVTFSKVRGITNETVYPCVVKCAYRGPGERADPELLRLLQGEHDIYQYLQEGPAKTGCVHCFDFNPLRGYLVLEQHGVDLENLLSHQQAVKSIEIAKATAEAVSTLHSRGIMHGDIKPKNILALFDQGGYCIAKLCDLDVAHHFGDVCDPDMLGTECYRPPEVRAAAAMGLAVTATAELDMFSLGLVLWQVFNHRVAPALAGPREEVDKCYADQAALWARLPMEGSSTRYFKDSIQALTCLRAEERTYARQLVESYGNYTVSYMHLRAQAAEERADYLQQQMDEQLAEMQDGITRLLVGQEVLTKHVHSVLAANNELTSMVKTLIEASATVPTLAIIVPDTRWHKLSNWNPALSHYRIYFIDSHTKAIAPCGPKRKGYQIHVKKEWVAKVLPVIRVSLVVLKLALLVSGLPIPVPQLTSFLGNDVIDSKFIKDAKQWADSSQNLYEGVKDLQEHVQDIDMGATVLKDAKGTMWIDSGSTREAYAMIKEAMKEYPDFPRDSGLQQVTHMGQTAWILKDEKVEQDWRLAVEAAEAAKQPV